jgi:hypothetical protein
VSFSLIGHLCLNAQRKFLNKKNLDVIWSIIGEKRSINGSATSARNDYLKIINGVYSLDKKIISGSLRLSDRE